jgi:sugar transferase (PEP-CTERM/EpsH1 system associated)
MRILWVKAGGLVPLDSGGKIRSYHILKGLARRHQVTLYTYYREHPNDAHHTLDGLFARVLCRPLRIATPRGFRDCANYVRLFFSSYPHTMSRYYRAEVAAEVRELARSGKYDVIVCDFLVPGRVIPWDDSASKVFFAHNVEALIYRRQYKAARHPITKLCAWRESQATARVEQKYVRLADHVLTVSEEDRRYFSRLTDPSKITAIPTGVDLEYFLPENEGCQTNTLVFTGSMDWLPNEDAMIFFAQMILPRVRRRVPNVSVLIVGRRPSPKIRALEISDPGIRVTGTVEDVRPYLRQGAVFIVPLRVGGGTRLKIFEAMAMGKAVVSTSVGAEGLPVEHGKNILIADSAQEFAESVTGLLQDPVRCRDLGRAARELVEREYSWEAVATRFEAVLLRMMEGRDPRKLAGMKVVLENNAKSCGVLQRQNLAVPPPL